MDDDRIIYMVKKNNVTIFNKIMREAQLRRGLQSRDAFMNANTEALQHGANYWLLSTGILLDLAENIKENNYEKESLDK